MADVNEPSFWEEIYQGGRAGWDLGGPTPVFRRLVERGVYSPGKMIVLGAGRGHDARLFAKHGFDVTAVDFADDAVQAMHRLAEPDAPIDIVQGDLFTLPERYGQAFDYVLEYTCFCAIDPSRRAEYADVVTQLLKPGGVFIALLFPLSNREGGPPFAVSTEEALGLFQARGFQVVHRELPMISVPERVGMEELLILQKADVFASSSFS